MPVPPQALQQTGRLGVRAGPAALCESRYARALRFVFGVGAVSSDQVLRGPRVRARRVTRGLQGNVPSRALAHSTWANAFMPGCPTQWGSMAGRAAAATMATGVEHAHGVGAPGAANIGLWHLRQGISHGQSKALVAHREVLRAVVKAAKYAAPRGHAATHAPRFFQTGSHCMARLHQGARGRTMPG